MTKLMLAAVLAAICLGANADTANTVKVTKFHQSYPYSGKATIEYTVGGTLPANAVAEIILNTDNASATFVQENIVTGANTNVIDFASSFGGALLLTNGTWSVLGPDATPQELWKPFATEAALKAGYDTIWYIGDNFECQWNVKP